MLIEGSQEHRGSPISIFRRSIVRMASGGLADYLEERGAREAEEALREAGVERAEDLEALDEQDLHNIGLSRRVSGLVLGIALDDEADGGQPSQGTPPPPPPPPALQSRRSTGNDLNMFLATHNLEEVEHTLEEMGIIRLADLEQLSPEDIVHLGLPADLTQRLSSAIDLTSSGTAHAAAHVAPTASTTQGSATSTGESSLSPRTRAQILSPLQQAAKAALQLAKARGNESEVVESEAPILSPIQQAAKAALRRQSMRGSMNHVVEAEAPPADGEPAAPDPESPAPERARTGSPSSADRSGSPSGTSAPGALTPGKPSFSIMSRSPTLVPLQFLIGAPGKNVTSQVTNWRERASQHAREREEAGAAARPDDAPRGGEEKHQEHAEDATRQEEALADDSQEVEGKLLQPVSSFKTSTRGPPPHLRAAAERMPSCEEQPEGDAAPSEDVSAETNAAVQPPLIGAAPERMPSCEQIGLAPPSEVGILPPPLIGAAPERMPSCEQIGLAPPSEVGIKPPPLIGAAPERMPSCEQIGLAPPSEVGIKPPPLIGAAPERMPSCEQIGLAPPSEVGIKPPPLIGAAPERMPSCEQIGLAPPSEVGIKPPPMIPTETTQPTGDSMAPAACAVPEGTTSEGGQEPGSAAPAMAFQAPAAVDPHASSGNPPPRLSECAKGAPPTLSQSVQRRRSMSLSAPSEGGVRRRSSSDAGVLTQPGPAAGTLPPRRRSLQPQLMAAGAPAPEAAVTPPFIGTVPERMPSCEVIGLAPPSEVGIKPPPLIGAAPERMPSCEQIGLAPPSEVGIKPPPLIGAAPERMPSCEQIGLAPPSEVGIKPPPLIGAAPERMPSCEQIGLAPPSEVGIKPPPLIGAAPERMPSCEQIGLAPPSEVGILPPPALPSTATEASPPRPASLPPSEDAINEGVGARMSADLGGPAEEPIVDAKPAATDLSALGIPQPKLMHADSSFMVPSGDAIEGSDSEEEEEAKDKSAAVPLYKQDQATIMEGVGRRVSADLGGAAEESPADEKPAKTDLSALGIARRASWFTLTHRSWQRRAMLSKGRTTRRRRRPRTRARQCRCTSKIKRRSWRALAEG